MTTAKMKYHEIASLAISTNNKRMAEGLIVRLNLKYNLSDLGVREYLLANGVDLDGWDELTATI